MQQRKVITRGRRPLGFMIVTTVNPPGPSLPDSRPTDTTLTANRAIMTNGNPNKSKQAHLPHSFRRTAQIKSPANGKVSAQRVSFALCHQLDTQTLPPPPLRKRKLIAFETENGSISSLFDKEEHEAPNCTIPCNLKSLSKALPLESLKHAGMLVC